MSMEKKKVKADIRGRAMAWLFLLCALLAVLLGLTLRPAFYSSYWGDDPKAWLANPKAPAILGYVSYEDVDRLFEAIPRALNGDLDALRLRVWEEQDGGRPIFNEREIAHMADVAHLYHLAKIVLAVTSLALAGLALWSWRRVRRGASLASLAKGALLGVLDVFALMGVLALWALIDFRSIFWAFHHLAFTNDLWLLDPNTDLLIQMMPQGFFEQVARQIVLYWAGCATLWCACWGTALYHEKKKTGQGNFN